MKKRIPEGELTTKLFFRLLPIQILLALVHAVNGTISGLFASNCVGPTAMSAMELYAPAAALMGTVSTVLVGGALLLCGKYLGKGLLEETQKVFSTDLVLTVLFSGLLMGAMLLISAANLTDAFTGDPKVQQHFRQYLLGQMVGVLPLMLSQQLSAFLSLENQSRRTITASVVFVAVNLALNALLVWVLRLEAFGLALASSLSLWVLTGLQLSYYFSGKSMLKLRLSRPKGSAVLGILKTGYPGALSYGYQTLRTTLMNYLILQSVTSLGLSALGAANSLIRLLWAVPNGMLAVSRMLISISVGEEDRHSLVSVMRNLFRRCVPIMLAAALAVALLAEPLTRLYYRDPSNPAYEMTIWGLRLIPLSMPLSLVTMHMVCYSQVTNKKLLLQLLPLLDGLVCVTGFTALLIPRLGMTGVYLAFILNGLVCLLATVLCAAVVKRRFPRNVEELLALPESFGVKVSDRIDINVTSVEEVTSVSCQVMDFCQAHGVDHRRAFFSGLCLEEMAGNVVLHGFTKDRKRHSVDIRVVYKEGEIILRIKDDCKPFDPSEQIKVFDPNDKVKNVGIRLVHGISKQMEYRNMLGLNVLQIRI
ncbi:MAG: ATP-binding protein [Oscillospiraceae bacterium]|nr:ATP-binding protein [Oscillospiraceae bacterium]